MLSTWGQTGRKLRTQQHGFLTQLSVKLPTMTPNSDENDFQTIVHSKCFELTKMLGSKGLVFSFKLTIGDSFCFSLDTMGARTQPAPVPVKKKKKSESAKRRDKRRRLEFLSRKRTVPSPSALLPEPTCSSASLREDLHSPVTPGADAAIQKDTLDTKRSENYLCICGVSPCVCLACQPLSPKLDHLKVPKVKITKSTSGWSSTSTDDRPLTSSPILSNAPICQNCNHEFLDHSHQCENDKDDDSSRRKDMSCGTVWEDSETLDLQACKDLVLSDLHSPAEKHSVLEKNCIAILKKEPIDTEAAKYCYSFAQYYKLLRDDSTLGYSMDYLVNKVFNLQFDIEISKLA